MSSGTLPLSVFIIARNEADRIGRRSGRCAT